MSAFRTARAIAATPAAVFDAIQDPARLARWWGPSGFKNTFQVFEFREGGSWVFTMHGPDGTNYPNQSQFVEIRPDAMVRIKHLNLPHFELSISLQASGNGTLLSWFAVFEDREFAEHARQFLETANEQNLDRLVHELAAHAPSGLQGGLQSGAS